MGISIPDAGYALPVPDCWSLPDLPAETPSGVHVFGVNSERTRAAITMPTITRASAMDFSEHAIARSLRAKVSPTYAIAEVRTGLGPENLPFAYSIIKSPLEPHGVTYTMTLHLLTAQSFIEFRGHFEECGVIGERDADVMGHLLREGAIYYAPRPQDGARVLVGWTRDPYTGATEGFHRNLAEDPCYDPQFPDHPLSHARRAVRWITGAG